jgi:hypothetical protein
MTEASGLTNDTTRIEHASEAIRHITEDMKDNPMPLAPDQPARRLSERLRRMTREAPLHSLAIAFLLGMLVARRR